VYVTGYGHPAGHPGNQTTTTAYDTATGAVLWTATGAGQTQSNSIALSPDGSTVYITGEKQCDDAPPTSCYLTTAYDAATGAILWTEEVPLSSYGGTADSIAVSPDGSTVYVTGTENPPGTANTWYRTIAYDAATGATDWSAHYAGPFYAYANSVVASASGVFVTGYVGTSPGSPVSFRTIAYSAATGTRLWLAPPLPANPRNGNNSLALSPDGSTVYMAGAIGQGSQGKGSFGTVAYDAATGAQVWKAIFNNPNGGGAAGLAVSPDGSTVYVAGPSIGLAGEQPLQYITLAYNATTGAQTWVRRFGDTTSGPPSLATSVAVSPDSSTVFVTGANNNHLTTVAYGS
jgi:sugar lactone lactonase YvrE